ncbi:MAG: SDR family oxidoreductase [Gemmatimonadetes bacterium]|nr:SDR family oxidoreductase [Gemmatimonadota bacterium]
MKGKRIFVTGGASGLGRALAERYARAGWRACIGDVNEERGTETVAALRVLSGDGHFLRCDVTREADLQAAADWLEREWGGVDVVVNNAGVAIGGGITEVPISDWEWIVDVNLLGVARGCRVFTPLLRRGGGGHLVNVASLAGLVHMPQMSAYNATKAAVVALSETLYLELAGDGIGVSVVCPAFFRTNLTESLRAGNPEVDALTRRLVNQAKRGADEIAEIVYRGVERGEFRILTDPEGRVAWRLKRLAPFSVYARLMARTAQRFMGGSGGKRPGG